MSKTNHVTVRQITFGLMRIDQGRYGNTVVTQNNEVQPTKLPFSITIGANTLGFSSKVYLPETGSLTASGRDIPVKPLVGNRVNGQSFYDVPAGTSLWCAYKNGEARLYTEATVPDDATAAFRVANVPLNPMQDPVVQFTIGTKSIDSGTGCWNLVGGWTDVKKAKFGNQYYMDGGILKQLSLNDKLGDFVCKQAIADDKPFVCLRIPASTDNNNAPKLEGFKAFSNMVEACEETEWLTRPLYKFTHDGAVEIDFRNITDFQNSESW